jgi:hypothetical protein
LGNFVSNFYALKKVILLSSRIVGFLLGDHRGRPGRAFPRAGRKRGGRVQYRGAPPLGQGAGASWLQPHPQGHRQRSPAQVFISNFRIGPQLCGQGMCYSGPIIKDVVNVHVGIGKVCSEECIEPLILAKHFTI